MKELTLKGIKDRAWQDTCVNLPSFDIEMLINRTNKSPKWIHVAPSNIYRAMIAPLQQKLIDLGLSEEGMIAIETYDKQVIDDIYHPHDNLSIRVVMYPNGRDEFMVIANVADSVYADNSFPNGWEKALRYFSEESLQLVSVTCTEKGYDLQNISDFDNGPAKPSHIMAKISALAYHRYKSSSAPITFVSMDNCSENGKKFHDAVMKVSMNWLNRGLVDKNFIDYLNQKVSFPYTMIDRITPRPSPEVKRKLEDMGIGGMDIITTQKGTVIAPYVNTEHISYLVIQDDFPNGRPPLEKVGVIFCDNPEAVTKYERMKVGACLNPCQTTLCIFGCLFNYEHIYDAINDPLLKELVYRQSYEESLPVVEHPGKIDPKEFLREVLEERLPNRNIPDTPARIITDTSQKVGGRYGETISAHGDNARNLKYIPLAIAGWCRYLLGLDDFGKEMNYNPTAEPPWNKWSPDPRLKELVGYLSHIHFGKPESVGNRLRPILSDKEMFTVDLYEIGLGERIEGFFREMISGIGAVRSTLKKYIAT